MQQISFIVPGPPIPKARARVVQRQGHVGESKTSSFTPAKTKAYERHIATIATAARSHHRQWPANTREPRFGLSVRVYRSREQGDLDNYVKSAKDALNGVLWADDWQVRRFGECFVEECEKGRERLEVDVWTLD